MSIYSLKRLLIVSLLYTFISIVFFSSLGQAADIQAQLDSNNGNSGLSVQNSSSSEVARVDSNGNLTTHGNVGVGSASPGQRLDVNGTTRTINFTMSGQSPSSGFVLTSVDSNGDATWSTAGGVSGWTITNTTDVYQTSFGNVGIGTNKTTAAALSVMNGYVGIGTWAPSAPLTVGSNAFTVNSAGAITATTGITQNGSGDNTLTGNTSFTAAGTSATFTGNVGVGSVTPGQSLDVNGTVRMTGLAMSGQSPSSGYVLTAMDSNGDATWSTTGAASGWNLSGNNLYNANTGNVGIGTGTPQGGLVVTNGNVGIGTFAPNAALSVGANAFTVNGNGVVTTSGGYTQSGTGSNLLTGETSFTATGTSASFTNNVGIGSAAPGQSLDVQGTVRTTGFAFSGQAPSSGYVLTALDSSGNATWSTTGSASGWNLSGNNLYNANTGNVGIGTGTPQGGFVVTNGNVGIGTFAPNAALSVGANAFTVNGSGAVSTIGGYTQSGAGSNLLTGQTVFSAAGTSASFANNVGVGTSTAQGAFVVANGNVGVGTWAPSSLLSVGNNAFTVNNAGAITATTGITQNGAGANTLTGNTAFTSAATSATFTGNVGVGTATPQTAMAITNGNVGIGTWTANGGKLIVAQGNVGIGSITPGQVLDVQGTVRTTGFVFSGQAPSSGYVLTALDSSGNATWSTTGAASGWNLSGNNLYNANTGNVGIGTATPQGGFVVTNGNVGIGTWTANGGELIVAQGNVGIGSITPGQALDVTGTVRANYFVGDGSGISGVHAVPSGGMNAVQYTNGSVTLGNEAQFSFNGTNVGIGTTNAFGGNLIVNGGGNVGIGSLTPGQALDVTGTVRTTGFVFSGQAPSSGYVLTALDSTGNATWSTTGAASGWNQSGNNLYNANTGNVGIGTATPQGGLVVTNGNVGIGTFAPSTALSVGANAFTVNGNGAVTTSGGYTQSGAGANLLTGQTTFTAAGTSASIANNLGIGTTTAQGSLVVTNGNVGIGTWAPTAPLAVGANAFTVNTAGAITATTGITQNGAGANTLTGNTAFTSAATSATFTGNVGVGTTTPQTAMAIANGNVGIGTWTANGGKLIVAQGNVGIGSITPGQVLDVQGTVRSTYLAMTGGAPSSGFVLTATDSSGDSTWSSAGSASGWNVSGTNIYNANSGNVGINTTNGANVGIGTSTPQGALVITNGNVGIGTWAPQGALIVQAGNVGVGSVTPGAVLDVQGTARASTFALMGGSAKITSNGNDINFNLNGTANAIDFHSGGGIRQETSDNSYFTGNLGIGTTAPTGALEIEGGNVGIGTWTTTGGQLIISTRNGNVGIGTITPGQVLDVQGTVRSTYLAMTGGAPSSGFVLTATDSNGDTTWSSTGSASGWNVSGTNIYNANSGNVGINTTNGSNVGIGTSTPQGALVITNGNVGIGTWAPLALLQVNSISGSPFVVNNGGNVGIGTIFPAASLDVGGQFTTSAVGGLNLMAKFGTNYNGSTGVEMRNIFAASNSDVRLIMSDNLGDDYLALSTPSTSNTQTLFGLTRSGINAIFNNAGTTPRDLAMGTVANKNFEFGTNNLERMRIDNNGNVGIGTTTPMSGLTVMNGNVGIGTWTAAGGNLIVNGGGNVGIGSAWPGQVLDVQGTIRSTYLAMTGGAPSSGFVLTATDSKGDTTWSSTGSASGWNVSGANLFNANTGNVGINTTNGANVGIGTATPQGAFVVTNGNVGIGTWTTAGGSFIVVQGNVGIGSITPGQMLDVQGTVRMSGNVGIGSSLTDSSGSPRLTITAATVEVNLQ